MARKRSRKRSSGGSTQKKVKRAFFAGVSVGRKKSEKSRAKKVERDKTIDALYRRY